jgi:hypothetical protein
MKGRARIIGMSDKKAGPGRECVWFQGAHVYLVEHARSAVR